MQKQSTQAQKITTSIKGLQKNLQADEQPLLTVPGIWDNGRAEHSTICDIILTDQRLFGYIYKTFPRERLFLDALNLADIGSVSLRQKTHEPLFRELLVQTVERKIYIRAPRNKIEALYTALREHTKATVGTDAVIENIAASVPAAAGLTPIYGKEEIRRSFENSPLAIALLFVGGILLEFAGLFIASATHSNQAGISLCFAGFVSVITAILLQRQRRKRQTK